LPRRDEAEEIRAAKAALEGSGGGGGGLGGAGPFEVVGVVGHSKGATTALLYASKYGDIPRWVGHPVGGPPGGWVTRWMGHPAGGSLGDAGGAVDGDAHFADAEGDEA
jgi:hypothetical protein